MSIRNFIHNWCEPSQKNIEQKFVWRWQKRDSMEISALNFLILSIDMVIFPYLNYKPIRKQTLELKRSGPTFSKSHTI